MLKRARAAIGAAAAALVLAGPVLAHAEDHPAPAGIRRPERLTVGVGDQFLGQLSPDEKRLYFATNRHTTNEIYGQDTDSGRVKILFDEGSDVTWPRVSRDGKHLLYISFRERATGQLCVRDLPKGDNRRCLGDTSAVIQGEWIDGERIALVTRKALHADLVVLEVKVGDALAAKELLKTNLTSPAISPDGRWLVYVPLERVVRGVGPAFAARAAGRLEAVRLDRRGEKPTPIALDLPGMSGQPAFSRDGKWLYFVQFFSDTNKDGVIDASDHGVLFRVAFDATKDDAAARAPKEVAIQLSDSAWNCQYPAPATDKLVATCTRAEDLDIYAMPLDGVIPAEWTVDRMKEETELAARSSELLLLYRHRLAGEKVPRRRQLLMMRLVMLHTKLEEFAPAEFYVKHIAAEQDASTVGLARALEALVGHRKAVRDRDRGRMVDNFTKDARGRMKELKPEPGDSPAALALAHVVRSEIADGVGNKKRAREELEAARADDDAPRPVLEAYFERADALYRELDDRDALIAVATRLSASKKFEPNDQLDYARAAVRAIVRGLPGGEAEKALARVDAPAGSELAFAVELGRITLAIRGESTSPALRDELFGLFASQTRVDRQRALMLDATKRASDVGADRLLAALAERYVDAAPAGSNERRRAERLYQRVVIGRAFRRLAAGHPAEARADFEAVAKRTGSLEGVVGAIDLRLAEGEAPERIRADYDPRGGALRRFVRAYLLARELPHLTGAEHAKTTAAALAELRAAGPELKTDFVARALNGSILHEDYLRTGDVATVERANVHYRVALELVAQNPRYKAMILGQLGLMHTEVQNYRIALGYLDDRLKLPMLDDPTSLAVRLARARALLHIGKDKRAADEADQALAMVTRTPALGPFRALTVDRAALTNLSAGRFERALALYDQELQLAAADRGAGARRNQVVLRLAHAAAAIGGHEAGRALADLDAVDRALGDSAIANDLAWPNATVEQTLRTYRMIAAGLRANASRATKRPGETRLALERRRADLLVQIAKVDRDDDRRALVLLELELADDAAGRGDYPASATWLGKALADADQVLERTHATMSREELDVLWFGAELAAFRQTPLPFDLQKRLRAATEDLGKRQDPSLRKYQRWFEIYGPLSKGP